MPLLLVFLSSFLCYYYCFHTVLLGPALAIAVAIASKTPSSEVIVSTDGESNMGVGMTSKSGGDVAHYKKVLSLRFSIFYV